MKYYISSTLTFIKKSNKVYNWLNGEYVEFDDINHPFLQLIQDGAFTFGKFKYDNSYNDFNWLVEKLFITENQKNIYYTILQKVHDNNSERYLQLTLLPAQMACNFSCIYCYEDKEQKLKMNHEHKNILLNYIKNINALEYLQIEWFGGEPMLNLEFIFDFSKAIQEYADNNNINYKASMTTNAYYLDKSNFLKLFAVGIRAYQITIDGLEETHNKLRPLSNGKPTFQTIINNLSEISEIKDIDFTIIIRVNFNEDLHFDEFVRYIKTINFSKDKRFAFIFRPIQTNWNNAKNDVFCSKKPSELQKEYERIAIDNGLAKGDYVLYKDIGSTSCYASRENSLIIYPDMSVRKCSIALDDEVNMVGHINQNSELIKNNNWHLWTLNKHSIHNKQECMSCNFNPQCLSSACPLKFIKQSEIICPEAVYDLENISNSIINFIENKF